MSASGSLSLIDSLISTFGNETINSSILSDNEWFSLSSIIQSKNILKNNNEFELSLLYRGTDDGFIASSFHKKCDGKSNTITLIHSEHGNVFGGFTKIPWSSITGWHTDQDAFLFVLRSNGKYDDWDMSQPIVYDINNRWLMTAVYHEEDWCACFGYCGYAICIHDHCDINQDSFSVHCETYSSPRTLAGKPQFKVIDYEMFQIL
eukprot:UN09480